MMRRLMFLAALFCFQIEQGYAEAPDAAQKKITGEFVNYEAFGAIGDGVADDLPAICAAHDYANKHGKPVRTKPDAVYHLGARALTAVIATDTDWNTSRFIIDDTLDVENNKRHLFDVVSLQKPIALKIDALKRDQPRLDVKPPVDCIVHVTNSKVKRFIRWGSNANSGRAQNEVFILRKDGTVEGAIIWDYDAVTKVIAKPIDSETLTLRGGIFKHVANRMRQEKGYNYWSRNIKISRSNTVVDGVVCRVTGETEVGHPYGGFLAISFCANITLRNCNIDGRKTYRTIGVVGKPVSMGTYGYSVSSVVNFHMIKCRMENINDRSRWGVMGCNYLKNILLEDCELSRMDVHQGASGDYIIRRTTLGHAGLNAIGRGRLIVEDSTLYGRSLITFRSDYGSTWEGTVLIKNSRWIPNTGKISDACVMFSVKNHGTHDFGYPCYMPREIVIDSLFIDDAKHPAKYKGVFYFSNPFSSSVKEQPYPIQLTETLSVRNLQCASGVTPRLSTNPELEQKIKLKIEE